MLSDIHGVLPVLEAAVAAVVAGSTHPDRQAWADEYVRAVNSDVDALVGFTPRD